MTRQRGLVCEQWTNSRAALVLTGGIGVLTEIAQRLGLPAETVIESHYGQAVLGLWGDPLAEYEKLKRLGQMPPRAEQPS
jgi:hypothetical protein